MSQISVIIPLYNKGPYIQRALDSVFTQSFENYEVIVVDDGSTDDGPEQVKAYSDSRLRLIRQENSGPGAARNKGIDEAHGKYVAFLDADDEWLPEFLEQSFNILEHNNNCDVCVSGWYQDYHGYSACGEKLHQRKSRFDVCKNYWIIHEGVINPLLIKNDHLLEIWFTSSVFVRRSVFLNNYRFYGFSRHTYGEDFYLWIQLAFNFNFYFNNKELVWYHNNDSDLSVKGYATPVLDAFMLWPEQLILNAKPERKKLIINYLTKYAITNANLRLSVGQIDNVITLIKNFPQMCIYYPFKSIKLLIKIFVFKLTKNKICW